MAEELRQRVVRQIEEAFADSPYPGDEGIGGGCGWEGADIEEAFRGKHWKELTLEFILAHPHDLPCMTDKAQRFYLPAYLVAFLNHYDVVSAYSGDLIYYLTPPPFSYERTATFLQFAQSFTKEEKLAVKAYIEAFRELYPGVYEMYQDTIEEGRCKDTAIIFWESI